MSKLFNMDNPVWVAMGKFADLIILNLLVTVCSIPVVTIGASWTAMYYVTIRMAKKEEGYITKDFFHSFRENFKQATVIWLIYLAVFALFGIDYLIYRYMPEMMPKALIVVIMTVAIVVCVTMIYTFPLLSRFQNTTKNTIKNALLLSILHIPQTVLLVLLLLLPVVIGVLFIRLAPLVIFAGISLPAYWSSFIWKSIFKKLEPPEETTEELAGESDLVGKEE